ncbi:DUF4376 domain-containing protein [Pseudomonas granadensis]|uniref:DUF4376 domain-containing protein n=1 Tax=Pseudomonas granadensis TaxID=1421430 RepID=UPI00300F6956
MRLYAWVYEGIVRELKSIAGDISKMFPAVFVWVPVPDGVVPALGWRAVKGAQGWVFSPPSAPDRTADELAKSIADERYRREGFGVVVDGLPIDTTRDSQSLIAGMAVSALMDAGYRCNFKTSAGFVELGAVQILAVSSAVRAHVQACFDREKALLEAIEAGEFVDGMLTEGWPVPALPTVLGLEPDPPADHKLEPQ